MFGYYIEVTNSFKDKVPFEYQRKQTLANAERFVTEELKELALFRLENPAMSLQEIANSLKIGKSCLNHRMRRLVELAEKIEGTEEK